MIRRLPLLVIPVLLVAAPLWAQDTPEAETVPPADTADPAVETAQEGQSAPETEDAPAEATAEESAPLPGSTGSPGGEDEAASDSTGSNPAAQPAPDATDAGPDSLSILFDLGSTAIHGDQSGVLDQAARLFRDGNPVVMIVSGSADTIGNAGENLDLSIQRARRVADGLVARGIPVDRLQVLGRGNSELPVPTEDGVAEVENRSVTITWR